MEPFRAHGALHVAVLLAIALATALAIGIRRRRGGAAEDTGPGERIVAFGYLAMWAGTFVWLNAGPRHDPLTTWPLQLCHWTAALNAIALVRPHRTLRAIAYFCGLALCTQALVTPSLVEGPAEWPFWFFWSTHAMIVAVPVYDIAARGFRPGLRDFGVACAAAIGYVAIVLPVDLATGWNYGFVGRTKPDVPTIVDWLGPWPQRLVPIVAISFCAMALLLLPGLAVRVWRARANG